MALHLSATLHVAIILAVGNFNGQRLNEIIGSVSLAKTFEMFECRDLGYGTSFHTKDYMLDCNSDKSVLTRPSRRS